MRVSSTGAKLCRPGLSAPGVEIASIFRRSYVARFPQYSPCFTEMSNVSRKYLIGISLCLYLTEVKRKLVTNSQMREYNVCDVCNGKVCFYSFIMHISFSLMVVRL